MSVSFNWTSFSTRKIVTLLPAIHLTGINTLLIMLCPEFLPIKIVYRFENTDPVRLELIKSINQLNLVVLFRTDTDKARSFLASGEWKTELPSSIVFANYSHANKTWLSPITQFTYKIAAIRILITFYNIAGLNL